MFCLHLGTLQQHTGVARLFLSVGSIGLGCAVSCDFLQKYTYGVQAEKPGQEFVDDYSDGCIVHTFHAGIAHAYYNLLVHSDGIAFKASNICPIQSDPSHTADPERSNVRLCS